MADLILLQPLRITVAKTVDGKADYMQIMSADQFSLNIVLISSKIEIKDTRS